MLLLLLCVIVVVMISGSSSSRAWLAVRPAPARRPPGTPGPSCNEIIAYHSKKEHTIKKEKKKNRSMYIYIYIYVRQHKINTTKRKDYKTNELEKKLYIIWCSSIVVINWIKNCIVLKTINIVNNESIIVLMIT